MLIVSSTAFAGVLALNYQKDYTVWVLPLLIVCLFAYLVAHCFLSVFENVVDVLFLCFAVDTKYNDGSPGREYYMDKALMVRRYCVYKRVWDVVIGTNVFRGCFSTQVTGVLEAFSSFSSSFFGSSRKNHLYSNRDTNETWVLQTCCTIHAQTDCLSSQGQNILIWLKSQMPVKSRHACSWAQWLMNHGECFVQN